MSLEVAASRKLHATKSGFGLGRIFVLFLANRLTKKSMLDIILVII
jgi:hypothetical protein